MGISFPKVIELRTNEALATVFAGIGAGISNPPLGWGNSALGNNALRANTDGADNTAVGMNAMLLNTTGSENCALGGSALHNNTSGISNVAIGVLALSDNTAGNSNIAIGSVSLRGNINGSNNTAVGDAAANQNTGSNNTPIGYRALSGNTSGENNVAVGARAGEFMADGISVPNVITNSVLLGEGTRVLDNHQTNQVVIGQGAIGAGSNTVTIGNTAITDTIIRGRLDASGNTFRLRTSRTPASATAPGVIGEICWDGGFVYVCTAVNTWRRAALTAW